MKNKLKNRLLNILTLFTVLLICLSVRLYFLQSKPSEKVASQLQNNQQENVTDNKYMLLDSNGKDLMKYDKKYIVVIDKKPFSLNNYEETLEDLMALNFIMKSENSEFNFTDVMKSDGKLYYRVSEETYNKVNKLTNVKGIYTYIYDEIDKKKAWSVSNMLSSLVEENEVKDSLESNILEYVKDNKIPINKFYLDAKAVYAKKELEIPDTNNNVKLTIDKEFEDKIREVLSYEEFSNLDNIGVSLMESNSGKIKALVQKDEGAANINLGIEGIGFEPGSIFKLITLGAALDKGIVTMSDTYTCNKTICTLANHGTQTVKEALLNSCNDVFAKIGNKIGYSEVIDYAEKTGIFKPVLNMKSEGKNETSGTKPKVEDGMNNISIGQCMTVSPLQMLGAINTIINDGFYVKPYIVDSIVDKNDDVVEEFKGETNKIYSKTTSKLVKETMKGVVNSGTGVRAKVDGIEMGGKTGSATSATGNTHGWFVGYFIYNNKSYTMVIFVPDIKGKGKDGEDMGGGNTAAPIFREIIKSIAVTS